MEFYGDSFKLHEMIDSDMRTEIDELMPNQIFSETTQRARSPTLTSLAPASLSEPMDSMDNIAIDSDLGNGIGVAWINGTQMYGFNMDFETLGGLLVNPQTGMPIPISMSMPNALSPVISSTAGSISLNDANIISNPQITENHLNSTLQFSDLDNTDCNITLHHSSHMPVTPSQSPQSMPVPIYLLQNVSGTTPLQNNQLNLNTTVSKEAQKFTESNKGQPQQQHITETKKKSKSNINNKPIDIVTTFNENEKKFPKPAYSYSCLIAMALKNSRSGSLPVNEIYNFMTEHFPYFKTAPAGWKNSVRHNLSLNKCFEKVDKPVPVNSGGARKGCLWAMNPAKVTKMEEELRKWRSRNAGEIRRSMANPEKLEMLEKGEMKPLKEEPLDEDEPDSDDAQQPVVSSTEEDMELLNTKIKVEPASADSSDMNSPKDELPSLESSIQLDDLELQKGLWDDLDDERLNFFGDTLSNSSLLNTPIGDTSSPPPTSNPVSFIHCNYVYSPMPNENISSSTAMLSNQESMVTSSGHVR